MLQARSMLEARLFMDLQPCAKCAHVGFGEPSQLVEHGDRLAVVCSGYCSRCGVTRSFELLLAEARVPFGAWGNEDASTLIDAGQWMALADAKSAVVPGDARGLDSAARERARTDLQQAIAAMGEVLKFIPAGSDRPTPSAFFTLAGRQVFMADHNRFLQSRIEIVIDAWRELAAKLVGQ